MKIVISNGSYKFHLAPLASELESLAQLRVMITSGWPHKLSRTLLKRCRSIKAIARYLDRWEPIDDRNVRSFLMTEAVFKLGDLFGRISRKTQQRIHVVAFKIYDRKAANIMSSVDCDIYHYRNCYGRNSVCTAMNRGIVTICDHSIGHPRVLQYMENNQGRWPSKDALSIIELDPLYREMENDLLKADRVLVNSNFVKETCVYAGMDATKIEVIYLGIDDKFMRIVDAAYDVETRVPGSLIFAGGWNLRKGATTVAAALRSLGGACKLDIAGGIDPSFIAQHGMSDLFEAGIVRALGVLSREELARTLCSRSIFIFPSNCEGSARVVFEAIACGCFVITTPNSGSIVEHLVNGYIVSPGDSTGLAEAIRWACENPDEVRKIGRLNHELVKKKYTQKHYGEAVRNYYTRILQQVRG